LNSHIAIIVAGTDARTLLGIDAAIRRGEAYAKAGADIIFIESPEPESERSDRPWMCR
jgi:2,3-dimethylmalate lyase